MGLKGQLVTYRWCPGRRVSALQHTSKHKKQGRSSFFCWRTYAAIERQLPFNFAPPMCLEGGRSGEAQTGRAAEKNLLQYQARCFLVAIPSGSSTQKRRRRPQKTWFIRMAIATNTTEFLLLPTCRTPTADDALPTCPTPTADDALPTCYTPTTDHVLPTCYTPTTDDGLTRSKTKAPTGQHSLPIDTDG